MQIDPEDLAFGERIINYVRWPLLIILLLFNNLGPVRETPELTPLINLALLAALLMTGYIQYRLYRGRTFGPVITLALAVLQDGLITVGVVLTGLYESYFFIFYYPSLLGFSLAFPLRLSLGYATIVGAVYFALCWFLSPSLGEPGVAFKVLVERWMVAYLIVAIGGALMRQERDRRRRATADAVRNAAEKDRLYRDLQERMEGWQQVAREIEDTTGKLGRLTAGLETLTSEIGRDRAAIAAIAAEIVDRSAQNIEHLSAVSQMSSDVVAAAHRLARTADSTGDVSRQAQRAVARAAQEVQALNRRSEAIGSLAASVQRLADQITLLAFNASIEAIQAGQGGGRFAVVAEEVRQVADQSLRLARTINEMSFEVEQSTARVLSALAEIGDMIQETLRFVQVAERASAEHKSSADAMSHSVETLEEGTQQTSRRIRDVSDMMERQRAALQQVAALSEELGAASTRLAELTEALAA